MRKRRIYKTKRSSKSIATVVIAVAAMAFVAGCFYYYFFYRWIETPRPSFTDVTTLAGLSGEFGEPFGVAAKNDEVFVSDGESGKIWRLAKNGQIIVFTENLDTPSAIAFDKTGDLIVADSGSHTIKRIDQLGVISTVAGTENSSGDVDGDELSAKFNAPIGIAVRDDGAIVVADTYNDKIKIIQDGKVTTLAGATRGFADGSNAQFDTPCGVAIWKDGRIIVADTENKRLRVIESDGTTWTLAGNGDADLQDGLLSSASFVRPMSVAVARTGELFIADGNAVRVIRDRSFPYLETLSGKRRGFTDGPPHSSAFNRISGLAIDERQNLIVADSDNGAIRRFSDGDDQKKDPKKEVTKPVFAATKTDPSEFRQRQSASWPFDPPDAKRDVAGTLGEIRGEIVDEESQVWFHNGLDIAGAYGETARFVRDEKVLRPVAVENFGTSRELIRMPTLGYIHIRVGRDSTDKSFGDARFQFSDKSDNVRVPRGTKFKAGDAIGTLNAMNHVHLIAGPSGDEMNALDALIFPEIVDTVFPVIEKVTMFDENWREIETEPADRRIKLSGNTRVVVRAYDRMDGNSERRRLGVYRLGYQILTENQTPLAEINWSISFDHNPDAKAVKFAYAKGSKSGATGETIFNYIVTNTVNGNSFREGFLDAKTLGGGVYILRVFAADFFGNTTSKDVLITSGRL